MCAVWVRVRSRAHVCTALCVRAPQANQRQQSRRFPRAPATPAPPSPRADAPCVLQRDWAHCRHICSRTGLAPATSAPGLGTLCPHRQQRHHAVKHTSAVVAHGGRHRGRTTGARVGAVLRDVATCAAESAAVRAFEVGIRAHTSPGSALHVPREAMSVLYPKTSCDQSNAPRDALLCRRQVCRVGEATASATMHMDRPRPKARRARSPVPAQM